MVIKSEEILIFISFFCRLLLILLWLRLYSLELCNQLSFMENLNVGQPRWASSAVPGLQCFCVGHSCYPYWSHLYDQPNLGKRSE